MNKRTKITNKYLPAIVALAAVAAAFFSSASAAADPAWLELGPNGRVFARTVVTGVCPTIQIDGLTGKMLPRLAQKASAPPDSQRLVCETDVTNISKVIIAGVEMHTLPKKIRRIVVLGDTGCRIKVQDGKAIVTSDADDDHATKEKVQDCNADWPFQNVADAAAAAKPDLIVHVGDYVYRESPCPAADKKECGGSPSGDNWATWDADFFTPAQKLLGAAPWIFVRGNHEICKRNGIGWNYYLAADRYESNGQCVDVATSFAVKLPGFHGWIYDSSSADDSCPAGMPCKQEPVFEKIYKEAAAAGLSHAWLISHRPIWAAKAGPKGNRDDLQVLNTTLQQAWKAAPIPGVEFVVAGHTHMFELMSFKEKLPVQGVLGNGGTELAHKIKESLNGKTIGSGMVANATTWDDFGYALVEPATKGWTLHMHDSKGKKKLTCKIATGKASCK